MINVRRSTERGQFDLGWLETFHSFSFGHYHDPEHMGFGSVRVINEDYVIPGKGFGTHPHDNMEIITYVIDGALKHEDSMGNGAIILPGEIQRMSAGTGITHSEFNPSDSESVHLLQIWILPDKKGHEPSYEQKILPKNGSLILIAGPNGGEHAVRIHQDAQIYRGQLAGGESLSHQIATERRAWLQVIDGSVSLDGHDLEAGDAAALSDEAALEVIASENAHFLLFDLA